MSTAADKERISWPNKPEVIPKIVDQLKGEHNARLRLDKTLLRLRFQRPIVDSYSDRFSSTETLNQLGFNTVRKVIDAARSRVCRPLRPVVMPVGADFELERNCKTLTRAVDGIMDVSRFWTFHAPQAFADCCTVTIGEVEWEIDEQTGEFRCERADPMSSFWHYDEGRDPVNLYAEYPASRMVLAAMYPKFKERIMSLPSWNVETIVGVEPAGIRGTDTVRVCKAWRRKIGGSQGHFAIVANDLILKEGPWNHDFFPRVACRWDQDFRGYGGYPGAAVLAPYQRWRNQLIDTIYKSAQGAVPSVSYHEDDVPHFASNVPFHRIAWSGAREPKIITNNPISGQLLQLHKDLDAEAHAEFGMNQQIAEGNMNPGVNSAPAQRERMAVADSRLYNMQMSWEQFAAENAKVIVGLGVEYYGKHKDKKITAINQVDNAFENIDWPLDLKANQYKIRFQKASGLSSTVWGKMQETAELRDRGQISETDYIRQSALPDTQATVDRIVAAEDRVLKQIEDALHEAKFTMPDTMLGQKGLQDAETIGTQVYNLAARKGRYPAKNMECLRRYVQAARGLANGITSTAPVMPVPAVLPGQPAGVSPMPSSVLPPMAPIPGAAPPVEPGPPAPPAPPVAG